MFDKILDRGLRRLETHVKGFKTTYDPMNPKNEELWIFNFYITVSTCRDLENHNYRVY